jgi:hypothetical protein
MMDLMTTGTCHIYPFKEHKSLIDMDWKYFPKLILGINGMEEIKSEMNCPQETSTKLLRLKTELLSQVGFIFKGKLTNKFYK